MLLLLGSIIFTSYLILSFKVCERYDISAYQAIVFNYFTCIITGSVVNGYFPVTQHNIHEDWFKWAALMGSVFIVSFNMIALTARKASVAAASVANKLSMVIPAAFSVWLYNESMGAVKIAGILIALIAVVLISIHQRKEEHHRFSWAVPLLIAGLFLISGLLDTGIKYVENHFLSEENKNDYLVSAFFFAGLIGAILLSVQLLTGRDKLQPKAIVAGMAIGIPNYFSIWCLVKVLKKPPYALQSSAIIPVNNIGILLCCSIAAFLLFNERLNKLNRIGIALSIIAIALITYGDKL
ncbi:MAG: EamA family transporter [Sphingobacteriales bacterium]